MISSTTTADHKVQVHGPVDSWKEKVLSLIQQSRTIKFATSRSNGAFQSQDQSTLEFIDHLSRKLASAGHSRESTTLQEVSALCTTIPNLGGLGLRQEGPHTDLEENEILFLVSAWLEALNSSDRAKSPAKTLSKRPVERPAMTMAEKILAMHDTTRRGFVKQGDTVLLDVDWIMASEIAWKAMEPTYNSIGKPGIFRNDRFWLAADHRVEPTLCHVPQIKALIDTAETAKNSFKMTEYQGLNYTIMHTEFFRERAQPGMLIIGSDSHTCSAGAASCLSIGLGSADVTMPLVMGQTWLKVPEIVNLRFINKPPPGMGGKDTILYILKEFKRNTIAADRIVEFTGPGIQYLSCDARFAIANMTTEFGGITGIFESDQRTFDHVNRRRVKKYKNAAKYFRADPDAEYWKTFDVDLSKVESFVAVFPSPDKVVPVSEVAGQSLHGCFIGACTTAEEDLIVAAMVLEEGMKKGLKPLAKGRRLMIPGSRPIRHKLETFGLTRIYEKAGFEIGVPGCSMCVGAGTDRATEGEVWLSSQNRNFEHRMGKGSIANLGSAATVAASSFEMKICNPQGLLDSIDQERLTKYLGHNPFLEDVSAITGSPDYVEPGEPEDMEIPSQQNNTEAPSEPVVAESPGSGSHNSDETNPAQESASTQIIDGKVMRLGDFIDTDAIAPSVFAMAALEKGTNEAFGEHCMEFFMPEFRQQVKEGANVVVAGDAFGCGSSRETAVTSLLGCGVQCVIAKSFAFIYYRNQPNLGLLGFSISDPEFYDLAQQGVSISIDLAARSVRMGDKTFSFVLSDMEAKLIAAGGISSMFQKFGKRLFDVLSSPGPGVPSSSKRGGHGGPAKIVKDIEVF